MTCGYLSENMNKYGFILTLAFVELVLYLSDDMYLPALTIIAGDLNSTVAVAQYTLSAWYLGSGMFQISMGPLCELIGRKNLLLIGVVIFILSSVWCASTTSMYIMILMRFLQGSSVSCIDVAGYADIHEDNNDNDAAKTISIISSISIFAPIIGPLLGIFFLEFYQWRVIFWFLSGCGVVSFFLINIFMKKKPTPKNVRCKPMFISAFKLFLNNEFVKLSIARGMLLGSMLIWVVQSPLVLMQIMSKWDFAITQSGLFFFFSAGTIITTKLIDKFSFDYIIKITLSYSLIANAALIILYNNIPASLITVGIFLFFISMPVGPIYRLAVNQSQESMGIRTSVFHTITNVTSAIAVFVTSFLEKTGFYYIFLSMLLSTCLAAFFYKISKVSISSNDQSK